MSNLKERLLKRSTLKTAAIMQEQSILDFEQTPTPVPMINLALSGKLDGGLQPGITMFAGPSKSFKTCFSLVLVSAFLKKHKDSMCIFLDSEFGASKQYFTAAGIDMNQVLHIPVSNIEEAKFELVGQLDALEKGDKVIVFFDSVGNIASKKETEDALNEKSVADMSRAKALKSFFRIITPYLSLKHVPLVVVNHTYKEMSLFPKDIVSGGTGGVYSSNDIFIVSKSQEKDGTELVGFNFTLRAEKSRKIKEGSKLPITVTFDGGINKYSGLFDLALELGFIHKNSAVSYSRMFLDKETGELVPEEKKWRRKEADCSEFWDDLLNDEYFIKTVEHHFLLDAPTFVSDEEVNELLEENE